jgi:hypothetical protein
MIRHQAVSPELDRPLFFQFGSETQIRSIVCFVEKRRLSAHTALYYVMREAGHNESRKPGHLESPCDQGADNNVSGDLS